MSEQEKENTNNTTNFSFLVNSTENDTLLSDTMRHKNLNDQFSENTDGRIELEGATTLTIENGETQGDSFILNNSIEYLVDFYKRDPQSFFDSFEHLTIDENQEKFEKLANIGILADIDPQKISDFTTDKNLKRRYVSTYIFLNMSVFLLKSEKITEITKILLRAKDSNEKLRKIVIQNLHLFYNYDKNSVLSQLILSLRDPKNTVQICAFESIKKIFSDVNSREKILNLLESQVSDLLSGRILCLVSDFLYDIFEENEDENRQFSILSQCSPEKIKTAIKKYKNEEKEIHAVYHMLFKKCGIDLFKGLSVSKNQKDKYCQFIIDSFRESKRCCFQENCHLRILNTIKYINLEMIYTLLEIIRDNKKHTLIVINMLNQINVRVYVTSNTTVPIIKLLGESSDNHCEEFFIFLKKLENNFEIYIDQILPNIRHKKLIGYFNTEPIDNIGVLCKALWNIKDEKYDQVEHLNFFEYQDEQIEEYAFILQFFMNEIKQVENKIVNEESQKIFDAMKSVFDQGIEHVSLNMENFKKNTFFYEFLVKFISQGYFRSESRYLNNSLTSLKKFLKKCKDSGLIVDVSLNYLISSKNQKYIKEISALLASKLKNQVSTHLFNKMKDLIFKKEEMSNLVFLIDILSLDERIILENMADGDFKRQLKAKCTEN